MANFCCNFVAIEIKEIYTILYTQGIQMFTPDFLIDTFQSTKKVITNAVFKDATLNKAAHNYIDAQTAFAKMMSHNAIDLAKYSVDSISQVLFPQKEQASQAPYKVEKEAD
jgi:hypothetical protein